jgi:hypothetical protein
MNEAELAVHECPYSAYHLIGYQMKRALVLITSQPPINVWAVQCDCGARSPMERTKDAAVEAWNAISYIAHNYPGEIYYDQLSK